MRISDWSSDVCSSDLVRPAPSFGKIDIAGAKEAGRLKTLRHRGARELEREAPPADLRPYQDRFLQPNPPPASPEPGEALGLDGDCGLQADAPRALEHVGMHAPTPLGTAAPPEVTHPNHLQYQNDSEKRPRR